ncbi:hypothetical protein Undi14_07525 [Undibacterium sp. 14-3-2]|jgi:DNA-binding IscR family transcriptional regulator|uniref:hypothetical protein n=1 Tax=Undibacterium sp. 14-3-2 TaxID=2800129 RepID=UPI001902ED50|nr:hypothetical protein [Undibacterium sp. 14-3-2]MBK1889884.1 hypothetical protein [Undibacterium sp. 14-3-2]
MSQFEQLLSSTQIFADANLNTRFYTAIELLAQIMMEMPRATNISSLVETTGKSPRLIRSILSTLSQNGLVGRDSKEKDAWHCRDCSSIFTLADVYRCFVEAEERALKGASNDCSLVGDEPRSGRNSSQQSVDLLLIQVRMTVNRAVLEQLEQFDLGRLRGLAATNSFRSHYARPRDYIPEPH